MSMLTLSGSLRYVALAALVAGGALVMRDGGREAEPIFGPRLHVTLAHTESAGWLPDDRGNIPRPACVTRDEMCYSLDDGHPIAVPGDLVRFHGAYLLSTRGDDVLVTDTRTGMSTSALPVARAAAEPRNVVRYGKVAVDLAMSPPRAIHRFRPGDHAIDARGRVLTGGQYGSPQWTDVALIPPN